MTVVKRAAITPCGLCPGVVEPVGDRWRHVDLTRGARPVARDHAPLPVPEVWPLSDEALLRLVQPGHVQTMFCDRCEVYAARQFCWVCGEWMSRQHTPTVINGVSDRGMALAVAALPVADPVTMGARP